MVILCFLIRIIVKATVNPTKNTLEEHKIESLQFENGYNDLNGLLLEITRYEFSQDMSLKLNAAIDQIQWEESKLNALSGVNYTKNVNFRHIESPTSIDLDFSDAACHSNVMNPNDMNTFKNEKIAKKLLDNQTIEKLIEPTNKILNRKRKIEEEAPIDEKGVASVEKRSEPGEKMQETSRKEIGIKTDESEKELLDSEESGVYSTFKNKIIENSANNINFAKTKGKKTGEDFFENNFTMQARKIIESSAEIEKRKHFDYRFRGEYLQTIIFRSFAPGNEKKGIFFNRHQIVTPFNHKGDLRNQTRFIKLLNSAYKLSTCILYVDDKKDFLCDKTKIPVIFETVKQYLWDFLKPGQETFIKCKKLVFTEKSEQCKSSLFINETTMERYRKIVEDRFNTANVTLSRCYGVYNLLRFIKIKACNILTLKNIESIKSQCVLMEGEVNVCEIMFRVLIDAINDDYKEVKAFIECVQEEITIENRK
jgi:hypothetical protein